MIDKLSDVVVYDPQGHGFLAHAKGMFKLGGNIYEYELQVNDAHIRAIEAVGRTSRTTAAYRIPDFFLADPPETVGVKAYLAIWRDGWMNVLRGLNYRIPPKATVDQINKLLEELVELVIRIVDGD